MSVSAGSIPVQVTLRGNVGPGAGEYAQSKVQAALSTAGNPVLQASVVLDWRPNPAVEKPALVEASVNVNGTMIRAKSSAPTMPEAVDDLEDKLRRQVVQLHERARERRRWTARSLETQPRTAEIFDYVSRPAEQREVMRRKSFASEPMTVDEAAYEMDLLGHEFFLYRDVASDAPAVVSRRADGGYEVRGADLSGGGVAPATEVRVLPAPPSLSEDEARTRLEIEQEPFVFYLDRASGDGHLLYRRYDGHYGLITLAV